MTTCWCGGSGADRIYGGAGNDRLAGGGGPDRVFGQRGRDRLFGGPGTDRLDGGSGLNRISGGADVDRCVQPTPPIASSCENVTPIAGAVGQAFADEYKYDVSANGRFVAFVSSDPSLVRGDQNGVSRCVCGGHVDRADGTRDRVQPRPGRQRRQFDGTAVRQWRSVVFTSTASNLVPADTNGKADVFARDRRT